MSAAEWLWLDAAAPISANDHDTAAEPSKFLAVPPMVKARVVASFVAVAALPEQADAVVAVAALPEQADAVVAVAALPVMEMPQVPDAPVPVLVGA